MVDILLWFINIAWKLVLIGVCYTLLKRFIKGGSKELTKTISAILKTIGLGIQTGCLRLQQKLVGKLQPDAAEKEEQIEQNDEPAMQVTGTVR